MQLFSWCFLAIYSDPLETWYDITFSCFEVFIFFSYNNIVGNMLSHFITVKYILLSGYWLHLVVYKMLVSFLSLLVSSNISFIYPSTVHLFIIHLYNSNISIIYIFISFICLLYIYLHSISNIYISSIFLCIYLSFSIFCHQSYFFYISYICIYTYLYLSPVTSQSYTH